MWDDDVAAAVFQAAPSSDLLSPFTLDSWQPGPGWLPEEESPPYDDAKPSAKSFFFFVQADAASAKGGRARRRRRSRWRRRRRTPRSRPTGEARTSGRFQLSAEERPEASREREGTGTLEKECLRLAGALVLPLVIEHVVAAIERRPRPGSAAAAAAASETGDRGAGSRGGRGDPLPASPFSCLSFVPA